MAMSNCSSADLKPHNHSRDDLTASIIIVTCSGRRYQEGCLSSVAAELWPGCELIVVDDGSTDLTAQVANPLGRLSSNTSITRVKVPSSTPAPRSPVSTKPTRRSPSMPTANTALKIFYSLRRDAFGLVSKMLFKIPQRRDTLNIL